MVNKPRADESTFVTTVATEEHRSARRYVDEDLGFEIVRPTAEWQLDETEEQNTPEGMAIPVVLAYWLGIMSGAVSWLGLGLIVLGLWLEW